MRSHYCSAIILNALLPVWSRSTYSIALPEKRRMNPFSPNSISPRINWRLQMREIVGSKCPPLPVRVGQIQEEAEGFVTVVI